MSSYTDLQEHFDRFNEEMRKAKNASGYTLQELTDKSGVSYNFAASISAGTAKQPPLYYSAAVCHALGLSLDRLMGLSAQDTEEAQKQRIHELELTVARQQGEIKRLEAERRTVRTLIPWLAGICSLLVCLILGYVMFDISIVNAGLFRSTGVSALAFALLAIILLAVAIVIYALVMFRRKSKSDK